MPPDTTPPRRSDDKPVSGVGECARRPLRADAERNRRIILDTASAVFAERGLVVGFDEIARVAGVGVGTVYRRFPDRDHLIDALFADRVQAMVDLATEAAGIDDPWDALVWFLEQSIAEQASDRGLAEVIGDDLRGRQRLESARGRLLPAVGALVSRAREAGALRRDVEVLDLAVVGNMLSRVATQTKPELWRRYLPLVLDGLRQHQDSEAIGAVPPDETDLAQLAHRR